MNLKPVVTEKAVMMIESQNILTFTTDKRKTKTEIKKAVEETFDVKVTRVRTLVRNNKKYAYVTIDKSTLAIDVATKLGVM